jgi:hypothetical protein
MTERTPAIASLIILCIFLGGVTGCAPRSTLPAVPPTPTVAPGWERVEKQGECSYVIDFPAEMDTTSQGMYSSIWSHTSQEPGGPFPNFVYVSVIPDDLPQSGGGEEIIYNYDPVETRTLLSMQVGESHSLREDPNLTSWFTYTRLPDTTLGNQAAQTYENEQPWEFPPGTRETRYYLQARGCTYLVGGYLSTVGSGQPGAIDQELFDQIIATLRTRVE